MVIAFHFAIDVDLFKTDPTNPTMNQTSSYLDLGPLYGTNDDDQKAVRAFKDGLLKPDTFSEYRVLGFPPGVTAMLVCFNRFHNYIAAQLAAINEGGRFSPPDLNSIKLAIRMQNPHGADDQLNAQAKEKFNQALAKRDNDLFQTARL
jgi:hypothetical protein